MRGGNNATGSKKCQTNFRIAKQFNLGALPYSGALGMELQELDRRGLLIDMPLMKRLVGDPRTGVLCDRRAVRHLMDHLLCFFIFFFFLARRD